MLSYRDEALILNAASVGYDFHNGKVLVAGRPVSVGEKDMMGVFSLLRRSARRIAPQKERELAEIERLTKEANRGTIPRQYFIFALKNIMIRNGLPPQSIDARIREIDSHEIAAGKREEPKRKAIRMGGIMGIITSPATRPKRTPRMLKQRTRMVKSVPVAPRFRPMPIISSKFRPATQFRTMPLISPRFKPKPILARKKGNKAARPKTILEML